MSGNNPLYNLNNQGFFNVHCSLATTAEPHHVTVPPAGGEAAAVRPDSMWREGERCLDVGGDSSS